MAELFAKLGIDWKLLIANSITFFIVLWLLWKFAYHPLLDLMDRRRKTIDEGLTNADKAKAELKAVEESKAKMIAQTKAESLQMLQDAVRDAETRRQELLSQAQADAHALLEKSKQQLHAQQQAMMEEAQGQLADLVVAATSKVVAAQLDEKVQRKLADQAVQEMMKSA